MPQVSYFQCDRPGCDTTTDNMIRDSWFTLAREDLLPVILKHCCSVACVKQAAEKLGEEK